MIYLIIIVHRYKYNIEYIKAALSQTPTIHKQTMTMIPLNTTGKKRIYHHYNIFQFQQKNSNRYANNASRRGMDYSQKNKGLDYNIIDVNQLGYQMILIFGQLQMMVYDDGMGNYPAPGNYVHYRYRMYYQGQTRDIQRQTINALYGKNVISLPFQLILALGKPRFKARIFIGPSMREKLPSLANKRKSNKKMFIDIQVLTLSEYPLDTSVSELENFHAGIVRNSIEGDRAFQNRDLETSLHYYDKTMEMILSQYYNQTIAALKKDNFKEEKQQLKKITKANQNYTDKDDQLQKIIKNKQIINNILDYSQKTTIKALEVAFFSGEYLKVIKWAYMILKNPKYDKNVRALMLRASSYVQMNQYEKAINDLKFLKLVYPDNQLVVKQLLYVERLRMDHNEKVRQKKQEAQLQLLHKDSNKQQQSQKSIKSQSSTQKGKQIPQKQKSRDEKSSIQKQAKADSLQSQKLKKNKEKKK